MIESAVTHWYPKRQSVRPIKRNQRTRKTVPQPRIYYIGVLYCVACQKRAITIQLPAACFVLPHPKEFARLRRKKACGQPSKASPVFLILDRIAYTLCIYDFAAFSLLDRWNCIIESLGKSSQRIQQNLLPLFFLTIEKVRKTQYEKPTKNSDSDWHVSPVHVWSILCLCTIVTRKAWQIDDDHKSGYI